jgi:hypothetical protein
MKSFSLLTCGLGLLLGACVSMDDMVATQRSAPLPSDKCVAKSKRALVLTRTGEFWALQKDTFVRVNEQPMPCLFGTPLSASADAEGRVQVALTGHLQAVSASLEVCEEKRGPIEALVALAFAPSPLDKVPQLYGFGQASQALVQVDVSSLAAARVGPMRTGLGVKSLMVDGAEKLLAVVLEADALRLGPINQMDGSFSPTWTVPRSNNESFWGAIETQGRFEILLGNALHSFDPATGVVTPEATLPAGLSDQAPLVFFQQPCL